MRETTDEYADAFKKIMDVQMQMFDAASESNKVTQVLLELGVGNKQIDQLKRVTPNLTFEMANSLCNIDLQYYKTSVSFSALSKKFVTKKGNPLIPRYNKSLDDRGHDDRSLVFLLKLKDFNTKLVFYSVGESNPITESGIITRKDNTYYVLQSLKQFAEESNVEFNFRHIGEYNG